MNQRLKGSPAKAVSRFFAACFDAAQADLVQSHETPPGPALGVGFDGLAGEGERVLVLAVVGAQLGEHDEGRGGEGGEGVDLRHDGAEAAGVSGQVEDRGLRAERLQVGGVHLQHVLGLFQRLVVVALEEAQAGEEGAGRGEGGVGGQRRLDRLGGVAAPFEPCHAGQAQERSRVGGVLGEDGLEGIGRLPRVVAFQEEFGGGQPGCVVKGAGGDGLVEGAERVVRVLVVPARQVDQGPAHGCEFGGREGARAVVVVDEAVEDVAGGAAVAVAVLEDAEFDAGGGAGGAGFAGSGLEGGSGLGDAAEIHESGAEEGVGAGHVPLRSAFGGLDGAVMVAGLAQCGDPPGEGGGVAVEGGAAQGPDGVVVAAGAQGLEAGGLLGGRRGHGSRRGRRAAGVRGLESGELARCGIGVQGSCRVTGGGEGRGG